MKKFTGKAAPPKLLRASFITWLRDSTDAPEVLKAAAKSMRHKEATQQSDRYDKGSHDRLQAAATEFVEKYARTFAPVKSGTSKPSEWELVPDQQSAYTFKSAGESDGKLRPFACTLQWQACFSPAMTLKFPVVPGLSHGLVFKLPAQCETLSVSVKVDAAAVKKQSFQVRGLMRKAEGEDGEDGGEEGGDGEDDRLAGWKLIDESVHTFKSAGERAFECSVAWKPGMKADVTLWWPDAPGTLNGILFKTPADSTKIGQPVKVVTHSTSEHEFNVKGLYKRTSVLQLPSIVPI